MDIFCTANFYW